jgi:CCR4-NOT transcription complex subunit 9
MLQVAPFILQKILLDDSSISYICQTYDRFSHVAMILSKMVLSLAKEPSSRLLKHVVQCYLRLSDKARASCSRSLVSMPARSAERW